MTAGLKGLTAFALRGAISRPPSDKFAVQYALDHLPRDSEARGVIWHQV